MKKQDRNNLKKIAEFPVGTAFSLKNDKQEFPIFGTITGIGIDRHDEIAFKAEYLTAPGYEVLINPQNVYPVDHDWDANNK